MSVDDVRANEAAVFDEVKLGLIVTHAEFQFSIVNFAIQLAIIRDGNFLRFFSIFLKKISRILKF